jgi:hypothetical protein
MIEVRAGREAPLPSGSLGFQANLRYDSNMKQSRKRVIPKKRGRPATGNDPVRAFRLSDEFMARVDAWASEQDDRPSRAEAIRRLVEIGLKAKK